jgi:hypothetical protein
MKYFRAQFQGLKLESDTLLVPGLLFRKTVCSSAMRNVNLILNVDGMLGIESVE